MWHVMLCIGLDKCNIAVNSDLMREAGCCVQGGVSDTDLSGVCHPEVTAASLLARNSLAYLSAATKHSYCTHSSDTSS